MKYLLLVYLDEKQWLGMSDDERNRIMGDTDPYIRELIASGKFLGGAPLQPTTTGATVRLRDGQPVVTDGPFAETREQVGGYTLIEAADMAEAVGIVKKMLGRLSPAIVEVRALDEQPGVPTN